MDQQGESRMKAQLALLLLVSLLSGQVHAAGKALPPDSSAVDCSKSLSQGRNRFGIKVPLDALRKLEKGLKTHASRLKEKSQGLLVDYSLNSKKKRSYLVDFKSCDLLTTDYVAHGGAIVRNGVTEIDGDPNRDGQLDSCKNRRGNRTNMTRPGLALTAGCHQTQQSGWTTIRGNCHGVKLIGLERSNSDIYQSAVVLHEITALKENSGIKPMGQGCPAFAPGRLKDLLQYGLFEGALVLVHAPQCSSNVPI
jgi:hypothetical protein